MKAVWSLTWPQVAMLLGQFVIGITDVWTAGRIGPDVQAAIGLVTQCQLLLMSMAVAATSGAVAAVSQSLGAGNKKRARRYVGLVLCGGFLVGSLLAGVCVFFRQPALELMRTPESLQPVAEIFLTVGLWALPGQYVLLLATAMFRAAKSMRLPLCVSMIATVLNVFGGLAFGLGWWGFPDCGAEGVAWATFASVNLGAVCMLFFLAKAGLLTRNAFPDYRWTRKGGLYLLRVALPAFGTSTLWQMGYVILLVITMTLPVGSMDALAAMMTQHPVVHAEISGYLVFNILSVPFTVGSLVLVGALNGAGATVYPMWAYSLSIWGVRLPLAWYLGHELWSSSTGIYTAMFVSQMVQFTILLWIVLVVDWPRFAMKAEKRH